MLRQSRQTRTRVHQICDGALFALSLVIAYVLREGLSWIDALGLSPLEPFSDFFWVPLFVAVTGPVFLKAQGFYSNSNSNPNFNSNPNHARRPLVGAAAHATVFTALAVVIVLFLARVQVARSVVIFGCALGGVFAYARAVFAERLASSRLAREQWRERVLWVGNPEMNRRHRAALSPAEIAYVADFGDFDPAQEPPERLAEVLHENAINTVIFEQGGMGVLTPYVECCAREGVSVVIRTGMRQSAAPFAASAHLDSLGGEAVIHYRAAHRAGPGALVVKRAMDVVLSAAAMAAMSPVFALVALVIKLTSRGPVLFTQTRAGLNGRPFEMVKFRTMRAGAEGEQGALAARNEMHGPVFKMENDPRITLPGRFLRRHAIDELPQLWNVLRGEMSLVGPRPLPVYEVEKFSNDAYRRRQSMRPGLTCLWQISGRNEIDDFGEWVRLDLAYIDRWSLWLDVRIMLATVPVVIFSRGGR